MNLRLAKLSEYTIRLHTDVALLEFSAETLVEWVWMIGILDAVPLSALQNRPLLTEQYRKTSPPWEKWASMHDHWIDQAHVLHNISGAHYLKDTLNRRYDESDNLFETYVEHWVQQKNEILEAFPDVELLTHWLFYTVEKVESFHQLKWYMEKTLNVPLRALEEVLQKEVSDPLWDLHIAECSPTMVTLDESSLQGIL